MTIPLSNESPLSDERTPAALPTFAVHDTAVRIADGFLFTVTAVYNRDFLSVTGQHPRTGALLGTNWVHRKHFRLPTPEELIAQAERADAGVLSLMDADLVEGGINDHIRAEIAAGSPDYTPVTPEPPVDPENDTKPLPVHLRPNAPRQRTVEELDAAVKAEKTARAMAFDSATRAAIAERDEEIAELKAAIDLMIAGMDELREQRDFERALNATQKLLIGTLQEALQVGLPVVMAHMSNGLQEWDGLCCKPVSGVTVL